MRKGGIKEITRIDVMSCLNHPQVGVVCFIT